MGDLGSLSGILPYKGSRPLVEMMVLGNESFSSGDFRFR